MLTFFDTVNPGFPAIGTDRSGTPLLIENFLENGAHLARFFDVLGTFASPVKKDIEGNLKKIKTGWLKNPSVCVNVRALLEYEQSQGTASKDESASTGLLWYKRGIEFMVIMLKFLVADFRASRRANGMGEYVRLTYDVTLKQHHNWFMQKIFSVVSHGAPYRLVFLQKLLANAADATKPEYEACVIEAIERFLPTIEPVVETLNALLIEFHIDPNLKSTALPPVELPGVPTHGAEQVANVPLAQ